MIFKKGHCKNQKGPLIFNEMERGQYPASDVVEFYSFGLTLFRHLPKRERFLLSRRPARIKAKSFARSDATLRVVR